MILHYKNKTCLMTVKMVQKRISEASPLKGKRGLSAKHQTRLRFKPVANISFSFTSGQEVPTKWAFTLKVKKS